MNFIKRWVAQSKPKLLSLGLGLLLVLLIGIADYLLTPDLSLSIFYLIPVVYTTWFSDKWFGLAVSFASAIAWLIADSTVKNYPYPLIPFWNAAVGLSFFVTVTYLLSALRTAYNREKQLARTDDLTGVINRRFFLELMATEIKRAHRYQSPLTLAYIDIDNFKIVNDRFGHSAGDSLLCLITNNINSQIRGTDVLARMGGDEFALLLPQTGYEAAHIVLNRVFQQLKGKVQIQSWSVSFSVGAVTFLTPPNSVDAAIERADRLMYIVKNSGKNRLEIELFDPSKGSGASWQR